MATITSTGIGSGLNVESLVSQLLAVERQPLTALQRKETSFQSKLSAFGSLKSVLSTFQSAVKSLASASTFQATTATVADATVASVSATAAATAGTYSLEVSKLAQAQQLVAAGVLSDSASIGTGEPTTITFDFGTITGGTFSNGKYTDAQFASSGSGVKTITIDSTNNSLAGIRDAINNAGIGVTASIVNDGSGTPYRLSLSSNAYGSASSMKISVSGDDTLTSLLSHDPEDTQNLAETSTAQNAEFKVNGIAITKSANSVSDVVSGVTLNLQKTTSNSTSFTVGRNASAITNAVTSFISAYNTLSTTLKQATAYDPTTKTAGALNGEASVRTIQTQLRNLLNTPIGGGATAFTALSQIGVTMQKDGTLVGDNAKLQAAINSNFDDFAGLFAAAGKSSDSLIAYAGASAKSRVGTYPVVITQLATKAAMTGTSIAPSLPITIDSSNKSLTIQLDGNSSTVTLTERTYTSLSQLASELQSKINGATVFSNAGSSVKVTVSGDALTLTSDRYGSSSKVGITGGAALGFNDGEIIAGVDVAGTINGVAASGSGQSLTGASGDASEGIKLTINGGITGTRGTISFSQGYAYQFDKLIDSLLGENGPITARTQGLNSTISRLQKDQERWNDRLVTMEKRYRAQFTALETLMSRMSTTNSYLTQQIAALENLNKQSSR